jgi:hypothetical protein
MSDSDVLSPSVTPMSTGIAGHGAVVTVAPPPPDRVTAGSGGYRHDEAAMHDYSQSMSHIPIPSVRVDGFNTGRSEMGDFIDYNSTVGPALDVPARQGKKKESVCAV